MTIDTHLKKEMLSRHISVEAQQETVARIRKLAPNEVIFCTYTSNDFEINLYETLLQAYSVKYRIESKSNMITFFKV